MTTLASISSRAAIMQYARFVIAPSLVLLVVAYAGSWSATWMHGLLLALLLIVQILMVLVLGVATLVGGFMWRDASTNDESASPVLGCVTIASAVLCGLVSVSAHHVINNVIIPTF